MADKEAKKQATKTQYEMLGLDQEDRTVIYYRILCKYQNKKSKFLIAAVFGIIASFTVKGERHRCELGKGSIADQVYTDMKSVKQVFKILLDDNLIKDVTPPEYKSDTQTKYYAANFDEFKNIKLVKSTKNKMTPEKKEKQAEKRKAKKESLKQEWPNPNDVVPEWDEEPIIEEPEVPEPEIAEPMVEEVADETPAPQYVTAEKFAELRSNLHKHDNETPEERATRQLKENRDGIIEIKGLLGNKELAYRVTIHNLEYRLGEAIDQNNEVEIERIREDIKAYRQKLSDLESKELEMPNLDDLDRDELTEKRDRYIELYSFEQNRNRKEFFNKVWMACERKLNMLDQQQSVTV